MPWATFVIVNPLVCAGLVCLFHQYPVARGWRPSSFFAIEPLSARERGERSRRISNVVWIGFGIGIVTALVTTSLEVIGRGWSYLDLTLIPALIIYPWLGASGRAQPGPAAWGPEAVYPATPHQPADVDDLYVALLFGFGTRAVRLGGEARQRHALSLNAQSIGAVFRSQSETWLVELRRRTKNADELRHGRIPEGLKDGDRAFLKSLDDTASEEHKKHRYALRAEAEEQQAKVGEEMFRSNDRFANYQKTYAEKYRKAAQEPWAPVEPDPPFEP